MKTIINKDFNFKSYLLSLENFEIKYKYEIFYKNNSLGFVFGGDEIYDFL